MSQHGWRRHVAQGSQSEPESFQVCEVRRKCSSGECGVACATCRQQSLHPPGKLGWGGEDDCPTT
jgi:hypothetical protein